MWRLLFGRLSPSTRAVIVASALSSVVARLLVVFAALRLGAGATELAVVAGAIASGLYVVARLLASASRLRAECDLYSATAHALLDGDVLRVPSRDLSRVAFEANVAASTALASTLPRVLADGVSAVVVLPVLVLAFPGTLAVALAAAAGLVLASLLVLRDVHRRLQARVIDAHERASDAFSMVIEGRLELVSRGADRAYGQVVDRALRTYATAAGRAGVASSLLARVPLAVGALALAAIVGLDSAARASLLTEVASKAVLLAASLPILLGVVLGTYELARVRAQVAPLLEILGEPPRAELQEERTVRPALPAEMRGDRVGFRYGAEAPSAFSALSFAWGSRKPLVLTGPNGSGKSTLLRLLIGLRAPSHGALRLAEHDLTDVDLVALRRDVAFLPQRAYLGESHRSLRDAMTMTNPTVSDDAILAALAETGVLASLRAHHDDVLATPVGELSSGQRQRVALARVLVQNARFVLLDEPDANLDRAGVALVADLIARLVSEGRMVAVAAHTDSLRRLDGVHVVLPAGEA